MIIPQHKEGHYQQFLSLLLDIDQNIISKEKQHAVSTNDILEILVVNFNDVQDHAKLNSFIKVQVNSISLKTRKKANDLIGNLAI